MNILRFTFVFLESAFKRMSDDGFSREKALIVIACAQASVVFFIAHVAVLVGASRYRFNFGFGIAIMLGLAILAIDYKLVKGNGGLDSYRRTYSEMSAAKKMLGGVVVVTVTTALVVASIVTAGMVARL